MDRRVNEEIYLNTLNTEVPEELEEEKEVEVKLGAESEGISSNLSVEVVEEEEEEDYSQPRFADIRVVGVGGGGCNAVHRMAVEGVSGVTYIAVNTDAQALANIKADKKIHIGKRTTRGLGTGNKKELAEKAAEESSEEIRRALEGADMIFITAGMGGGTGTGASPIIAKIAKKELDILTIAIVTKPFSFEGKFRRYLAEEGISRLKEYVDALIVVQNDKLLELGEELFLLDAFKKADEILKMGIQGVTDIIVKPGIINVDFADIKSVMEDAGTAWLGIGEASGEDRAKKAAEMAINNPLVEHSIEGAKKLLVNITGGPDLKITEVNEAMNLINQLVDDEVHSIFGVVQDESMRDTIRVTVIATNFSSTPYTYRSTGDEYMEYEDVRVTIDTSSIFEELPPTFSRRRY